MTSDLHDVEAPASRHGEPLVLREPDSAYLAGSFAFRDASLAATAAREGPVAAWREAFERYGAMAPVHVSGSFAVAMRTADGRVWLAVDRFSIEPLCYAIVDGIVSVDRRADRVAGAGHALDEQSLFAYFDSHVIPTPRTVFRGVRRLPPGYCLTWDGRAMAEVRWWVPSFRPRAHSSFAVLQNEFRAILEAAVARHLEDDGIGCFLSGGTDSSTVVGLMAKLGRRPPKTFSIGFDAKGYDEMAYARITARHFGSEHHEYYVKPADLVAGIPKIAASLDQPFGNSSLLPTFLCARFAHAHGVARMLAGDGGDELFGGNTRYAKQRLFDAYRHVPAGVRRHVIEPMLIERDVGSRVPLLRKARSYVIQAREPMPGRARMHNLIAHLGLETVLTTAFLDTVNVDEPLRHQQTIYEATHATSLIDRMLAFDWRHTLADNDLPKVNAAADAAGIEVRYPLLDDDLVDFSLELAPNQKLRGMRLRWFFKEALRGFLPDATIAKSKHGFGLPFGVWLQGDAQLREFAHASLTAFADRGIVRAGFVADLFDNRLADHAAYYGEMVWILMMLEQWLASHSPSNGTRS